MLLAVAEFVLLRVVNRMSGAFPAWARGALASDLSLAGVFAYNAAYLLSLALLVLVALHLSSRDLPYATLLVTGGAAVLAAQAFGSVSVGVVAVAGLLGAAVLVATVVRAMRTLPRPRSPPGVPLLRSRRAMQALLLLVLGTFLAGLYLHLGDALANLGVPPPARTEVYAAGEVLGVLAAIAAAVAFWRRPDPWNIGLAATGIALVAAPALVRPEVVPLIGYWSFGFRLDLTFPLYVAAAGAIAFAIANAARAAPHSRYLLYGLVLVVLAGRQLPDFYSVQLAVSGVILLGFAHVLPTADRVRAPRATPGEAAADYSGDDARVTRTSSR